jgi:hypothetical protein
MSHSHVGQLVKVEEPVNGINKTTILNVKIILFNLVVPHDSTVRDSRDSLHFKFSVYQQRKKETKKKEGRKKEEGRQDKDWMSCT